MSIESLLDQFANANQSQMNVFRYCTSELHPKVGFILDIFPIVFSLSSSPIRASIRYEQNSDRVRIRLQRTITRPSNNKIFVFYIYKFSFSLLIEYILVSCLQINWNSMKCKNDLITLEENKKVTRELWRIFERIQSSWRHRRSQIQWSGVLDGHISTMNFLHRNWIQSNSRMIQQQINTQHKFIWLFTFQLHSFGISHTYASLSILTRKMNSTRYPMRWYLRSVHWK